MHIMNGTMPTAAKRAFEEAHRARSNTGIRNRTPGEKQTGKRSYRLTADFQQYRRDERAHCERRKGKHRDDIRALEAKTFLLTRHTPRLTAKKPEISRINNSARRHSAAQARSPERRRAAMTRHMNTVTHSILKARGLK